jgi:hypothetical protein
LVLAVGELLALEYEEVLVDVARIYDLKAQQVPLRTPFDVRVGDSLF